MNMFCQLGFHSASLPEIENAAPEWVHLFPLGTFKGRDGRGPYILNDPKGVIAATKAGGIDIPIDYDHQLHHTAKNGAGAPAAGWIKDFAIRDTGLWGRVEWTPKAKAMIVAREYRFLSPAFTHAKDGNVIRLIHVGLVNNPNLELTALANAGVPMSTILTRLKALLGLPETSDDDQLIAAVALLKRGKESTEESLQSAIGNEAAMSAMTAMATELQELRRSEVTRKIEEALSAGRITPAMREWAMALCSQNPASFDDFLEKVPVILPLGTQMPYGHMHPSSFVTSGNVLSPDQLAVCRAMGHAPEEYKTNLEP